MRRLLYITAALVFLTGASAFGATNFWWVPANASGNRLFSTGANWTNELADGTAPTSSANTVLYFIRSQASPGIITNDIVGLTIKGMEFGNGTYQLKGESITLTNSPYIDNLNGTTRNIYLPLVLAEDTTFGGSALSGAFNVTNSVSGLGGIIKTNLSSLNLTGPDNSFTGHVVLKAGTISGTSVGRHAFGYGPLVISNGTVGISGNNIQYLSNSVYNLNGNFNYISSGGNTLIFDAPGTNILGTNITITSVVGGSSLALHLRTRIIDNGAGYGIVFAGFGSATYGAVLGNASTATDATNSTFSGAITISNCYLYAESIASIGAASSAVGAPSNAVTGQIDMYGTAIFSRRGSQGTNITDRIFNIAGSGSHTVTVETVNNGSYTFNTVPIKATGTGPATLNLNSGISSTGDGAILSVVSIPDMSDGSSVTVVAQTGSQASGGSKVYIGGTNAFTGTLTTKQINNHPAGTVYIDGLLATRYVNVGTGGGGASILSITNNVLNPRTVLTIATGASWTNRVNLRYTGTNVIARLIFGSTVQSNGLWGAIGTTATFTSTNFTGAGILNVNLVESEGAIGVHDSLKVFNSMFVPHGE